MSSNDKIATMSRYDFNITFDTLEAANNFILRNKDLCFSSDYNTAVKVDDQWVVTNKYDPHCDDKITPVRAGYMYHG